MIQDVSQIGAPAQTIHHVFVETPDLPSALRAAKDLGYPVDRDSAVYFWRAGVDGCCGGVCHASPSCSATRREQSICAIFRHATS